MFRELELRYDVERSRESDPLRAALKAMAWWYLRQPLAIDVAKDARIIADFARALGAPFIHDLSYRLKAGPAPLFDHFDEMILRLWDDSRAFFAECGFLEFTDLHWAAPLKFWSAEAGCSLVNWLCCCVPGTGLTATAYTQRYFRLGLKLEKPCLVPRAFLSPAKRGDCMPTLHVSPAQA